MTVLLLLIYLSFISLGLPDSLFGSAWPVIQTSFGVPLSAGGWVTMTISGGTIVASLFSDRLTYRFGAGKVTAVSVGMTAGALIGFSLTRAFPFLIVCAVPLGLGGGAVDAALNNYVALHYSSRQMSWLHCFWGIGASISPYVMGFWLHRDLRWDRGYLTVGLVQVVIAVLLAASLPLWKRGAVRETGDEARTKPKTLREISRLPGVFPVLISFFAYCAVEGVAFAWTGSYLTRERAFAPENAARFSSLFYLGMTLSRFLTGFVADKLGDRRMIRYGFLVTFAGLALVFLPWSFGPMVGLCIAGFGCGPIYPAIIHATPTLFGRENSQAVVGVQMASAYCGTTFMPPLFGLLAEKLGLRLFPFALVFFTAASFILTFRFPKDRQQRRLTDERV